MEVNIDVQGTHPERYLAQGRGFVALLADGTYLTAHVKEGWGGSKCLRFGSCVDLNNATLFKEELGTMPKREQVKLPEFFLLEAKEERTRTVTLNVGD